MVNLFKNFGKGLIYILVLPVLAVALVIYGVAAIFVFIFLAIKGLFLFFTGRSLYEDLPEDIEAKKRLGIIVDEPEKTEVKTTTPEEKKEIYNETTEQKEVSVDPFYVPEYLKTETAEPEEEESVEEEIPLEEEPQEELHFDNPLEKEPEPEESFKPSFVDEPEEVNPVQETVQNEPEEPISNKKPQQNASIFEISDFDDEEEEEDNSGVNIDYE